MSLDVYLKQTAAEKTDRREAIFIRENGQTKEISRDDWTRRYPDRQPCVVEIGGEYDNTVYSANITHNLGEMADDAGLYEALWRPDECGFTKAKQLIPKLIDGLSFLVSDPKRFEEFNPSNGWGNYHNLCQFVAKYLAACVANPDADVSVSR